MVKLFEDLDLSDKLVQVFDIGFWHFFHRPVRVLFPQHFGFINSPVCASAQFLCFG